MENNSLVFRHLWNRRSGGYKTNQLNRDHTSQMIDLTNDDQVYAATLYGEARGEGPRGIDAVAWVILNRVRSAHQHPRKQFGDGSFRSACLSPYQFSCWLTSDPNRDKLLILNFDNPDGVLAQCISSARRAIDGMLEDPSGGLLTDPAKPAQFYKVTSLPWPHDWGTQVPELWSVGHHSFYHLP